MKVDRSLILILMLLVVLGSACNNFGQPSINEPSIRTAFSSDQVPAETAPPALIEIDWSWDEKLTIQGLGFEQYPVFIGDMLTGDIVPFRLNNAALTGSIPIISKDGRYLAFQSEGKLYIGLMDTIASKNYSITPDSYVKVFDEKFRCNHAWSPESSQLASVCLSPNGITISRYDLIEQSLQTEFEYSEKYIDEIEGTSWSSSGNMLAFSLRYEYHDQESSQTDIFVYDLDDKSLIRITNSPKVEERNPVWYPGNRVLTFTATIENDSDVDASLLFSTEDGKCVKPLANMSGFVNPAWSPDGSQLAYIDGWKNIKVLDASQFIPPDFLSPQSLCNSS